MKKDAGLLFDFDITFEEFEFHRWIELPFDLKANILEYIPFPTLRNFMLLSKESYRLVTRMKIPVFYIELSNVDNFDVVRNFVSLSVAWLIPGQSLRTRCPKTYTLHFVEDGRGGCSVERVTERNGRRFASPGVHYDCSPLFVALTTMIHFSTFLDIREAHIRLDACETEVEHIFEIKPVKTLIAREEFFTNIVVPQFLHFLLPGCRLKVYPLRDHEATYLDTPFFDSTLVHSSSEIFMDFRTGVTDDQIVKFRAHDITMEVPYVTAQAINRMILEWYEGERNIDVFVLKGLQNVTKADVLRNVEVVPWEEFLTMIYNGDWWGLRFNEGQGTGLYNGTNFLIVLVEAESCQLLNPYFCEK